MLRTSERIRPPAIDEGLRPMQADRLMYAVLSLLSANWPGTVQVNNEKNLAAPPRSAVGATGAVTGLWAARLEFAMGGDA